MTTTGQCGFLLRQASLLAERDSPARYKEETIKIIDKTLEDFYQCEGGEAQLKIDGEEYITDAGYALDGMKIFAKVLKKRLGESDE